jgi:hypothetical protein
MKRLRSDNQTEQARIEDGGTSSDVGTIIGPCTTASCRT